MAEKEIQVFDFMKQNNLYIDYQNIDINDIERKLENDNLTAIERRRLEAIHKNCMLLKKDAFTDKTNFLEDETRREFRKKRLEEMKKVKEKTLHARKILIRAGIITLLASGGIGGLKIYHDTQIKPIEIINEKYDKTYSSIEVEKDQTLTDIAEKIYESYPDDVKKVKTINDLINEIVNTNHIEDPNKIRSGQTLIVPSGYVESIDEISNDKTY